MRSTLKLGPRVKRLRLARRGLVRELAHVADGFNVPPGYVRVSGVEPVPDAELPRALDCIARASGKPLAK